MAQTTLAPGVTLTPGYLDRAAQDAVLAAVRAVIAAAPLYVPRMPRSGKPMSVMMTNCGPRLGHRRRRLPLPGDASGIRA